MVTLPIIPQLFTLKWKIFQSLPWNRGFLAPCPSKEEWTSIFNLKYHGSMKARYQLDFLFRANSKQHCSINSQSRLNQGFNLRASYKQLLSLLRETEFGHTVATAKLSMAKNLVEKAMFDKQIQNQTRQMQSKALFLWWACSFNIKKWAFLLLAFHSLIFDYWIMLHWFWLIYRVRYFEPWSDRRQKIIHGGWHWSNLYFN